MKKKTYPKFFNGGSIPTSSGTPQAQGMQAGQDKKGMGFNLASALQQGIGQVGGGQTTSIRDEEFQAYRDIYDAGGANTDREVRSITSGISDAVGAIPGWGTVISLGLKAGSIIGDKTKDDYGIYSSKGGEYVNRAINPMEGAAGVRHALENPTWNNIGNQLSGGLLGKDTRQEELKRLKKQYDYDVIKSKAAESDYNGAVLKNSIPVYQAPAYGREGLKIPKGRRFYSKFSKFK